MIGLVFRILRVAKGYRGRIALAAVFSFLKAFCVKIPYVAAYFLFAGFLANTVTSNSCLICGGALLASVAMQCIFQNLADRLQSASGFEIFAEQRIKLGKHLRKLPMGYFTEGNIGKISTVLATDMVFIEENLMMVIGDLMSYLFSAVLFVIMMFFFHPYLGIASLVVTVIMYAIGEAMKNSQIKHSRERQESNELLTEAVLDFTEGMGIIKTYNLLGDKSKALSNSFSESCDKNLAFEESHAPWSRAINMTYALGSVIMLILLWLLYQNATMSLDMFIGAILFIFELFSPLKAFYGQTTRLTVMSSCLDRIEAVLEENQLDDKGTEHFTQNSDAPEIEFRNVTFAYDKGDVIKDISFKVEKNTMTALVGPSGGGKSTIASLLPRFWDIEKGVILVRGTDIKKVPLAELMDNISMVFQRVYLFQDTIYNNIAMGRTNASREEVIEAAKKARCYDFIMALPEGFDTVIGEGGTSLSGGEQQRISIARCILKDAPIVILDEATASVDADNESQIQAAISELVKGKTLLVIAHRLHTIAKAEQILVINDKHIAEQGDHEKLLADKGVYYNMVNKRASVSGFHN